LYPVSTYIPVSVVAGTPPARGLAAKSVIVPEYPVTLIGLPNDESPAAMMYLKEIVLPFTLTSEAVEDVVALVLFPTVKISCGTPVIVIGSLKVAVI